MNRPSILPFIANLSYYLTAPANFARLRCRGCRNAMDIHQPDPNRADQFLGTCSGCGRWYRVGLSTDGAGLVVLDLPEVDQVEASPPASKDGTG